jgi:hypothetical protein
VATKSFYLTATTGDGWRALSESTQAAATNADGWAVGTGATLHAEYAVGVERASTVFTGTTVPDGTLDTTLKDAFRTPVLAGDFAAGNWTFNFVLRPVTVAGTQNGRIRFRLIKADADGSSATEITSAQQQGSLVGAMASTTTDYTSTLTFDPGAFSLRDQYLFIQIAWERTAAGSMSTSDVNWRTGSSASLGTRIVTTDFTATPTQTVRTVLGGKLAGVDSYDQSNYSTSVSLITTGHGVAQSFVGNGGELDSASFFLSRTSGHTGPVRAEVYQASGTHGTNAVPQLSALAVSDTVDISTFPVLTTFQLGSFVFQDANRITLTNGTTYCVGIFDRGTSGSGWNIGVDDTAPTHAGNGSRLISGWSATAYDTIFGIYTRTPDTLYAPTVFAAPPADQGIAGTTLAAGSVAREPSVAYAITTPGQWLADSYAFSEAGLQTQIDVNDPGAAQSIVGDGRLVDVAVFMLGRGIFTTGGTVSASLYASTGTHGTNAIPIGSPLATSATVAAMSLPLREAAEVALGQPVSFVFDAANRVTLTNGVTYCIAVEYASPGGGGNVVYVYNDFSAPSHSGNAVRKPSGVWTAAAAIDRVFQVWTRTYAQTFAPTVAQQLNLPTIASYATLQVEPGTASDDLDLNDYRHGQSFLTAAPFSAIEIQASFVTPPDGTLVLEVVTGAITSSTVLASATMAGSALPATPWIRFTLNTVIVPSGATTYYWRLKRTSFVSGALTTYRSAASIYADGQGWLYVFATGTWQVQTYDRLMRLVRPLSGPTVVAAQAVTGTTIASGSVAQEPSVAYGILVGWQAVVDQFAFSNRLDTLVYFNAVEAFAQSITGSGQLVDHLLVLMHRTSLATSGTLVARLYATTGTHGTSAKPTGSALADSDPVDVATLPAGAPASDVTPRMVSFAFTGANRIALTNGTIYCWAVELDTKTGDLVHIWRGTNGHAGNRSSRNTSGVWTASTTTDFVFQLWSATGAQAFAPTVTIVAPAQAITAACISSGGYTDELVYWALNENTGTTSADATGHGHTLTIDAAGSWVTGKFGASALHCDGTGKAAHA